jgi:putative transposase
MTTMTISREVLDELLNGVKNAVGDQGLMKELKVRLMERMLGAELSEHLGYEPDAQPTNQQSNRRNGTSRKTLKGNDGALPIDVPRDREGSFEPELIKKGQTRIDGMDDKIIHCPTGACKACCREAVSMQPDYRPATSVLTSKRSMV